MELPKINRNSRDWEEVFSHIDSNFEKLKTYADSLGRTTYQEKFNATEGQTDFNLSHSYNTRTNSIEVYRNGIRQWLPNDFTETSNSSIRLSDPCSAHDVIRVQYVEYFSTLDSNELSKQVANKLDNNKREIYSSLGGRTEPSISSIIDWSRTTREDSSISRHSYRNSSSFQLTKSLTGKKLYLQRPISEYDQIMIVATGIGDDRNQYLKSVVVPTWKFLYMMKLGPFVYNTSIDQETNIEFWPHDSVRDSWSRGYRSTDSYLYVKYCNFELLDIYGINFR